MVPSAGIEPAPPRSPGSHVRDLGLYHSATTTNLWHGSSLSSSWLLLALWVDLPRGLTAAPVSGPIDVLRQALQIVVVTPTRLTSGTPWKGPTTGTPHSIGLSPDLLMTTTRVDVSRRGIPVPDRRLAPVPQRWGTYVQPAPLDIGRPPTSRTSPTVTFTGRPASLRRLDTSRDTGQLPTPPSQMVVKSRDRGSVGIEPTGIVTPRPAPPALPSRPYNAGQRVTVCSAA